MADQNVTAGIRGVQALADKENELRRVKETLAREQREKAAAEAKLAAAEARLKTMVSPSHIASGVNPSDPSLAVRQQMAHASVQAAAQAHAARQAMYNQMAAGGWGNRGVAQYAAPIGPAPLATFGQPGAASPWNAQGAAYRAAQADAANSPGQAVRELVGGLGPLGRAVTTLGPQMVAASAAVWAFKTSVELATQAENNRRSRATSANEALGMVGTLPGDLEGIVRSGASAGGGEGAISPEDARQIAAQYGGALANLGPAASAVSQAERARQLREYIKARRRGVSMTAIGAAIGQNASPIAGVGTSFMLSGAPTQSSVGLTEAQDAASLAAEVAKREDVRTAERDAAYRAQSDLAKADAEGNIFAKIPLAKEALVLREGLRNGPEGRLMQSIGDWFRNASNTRATLIPSPVVGREGL